jgi:predicted permease
MFSWSDIIHAWRLLKKTPKFTVVMVLILSGGLTISLFTFQFVYGLMYKTLPLPGGEGLYRAGIHWVSEANGKSKNFPAWELAQVRQRLTGVEQLSVWQNKTLHVSLGENNRVVAGVRAEGSLLQASGVQPLQGRYLQPSDSQPGQAAVAVIGYGLWKNLLGGRDDVLGQRIFINGVATEIVGVMPAEFHFPVAHDLWLPIEHHVLNPVISDTEDVEVMLRLKAGVAAADAEQNMFREVRDAFAQRSAQFPGLTLSRAQVSSFHDYDISNSLRIFLWTLNGIAGFILLLACINISNLLYARAIQRGKESAIRIALGATRKRLIMQLMWEGLLITMAGGLLSLVITAWVLQVFHVSMHSLMQGELAFWYIWELDLATLGAAAAFILFVLYIACYTPARRAADQEVNSALRDGTRGAQGKAAGRASRVLVTLQIMLITIISLLGSVIALKVNKIIDVDLGINVSKTYFAMMSLPEHDYKEPADYTLFYETLNQRLLTQPEISDAFVQFDYGKLPLTISGVEYPTDADKPKAAVTAVIGDFAFRGPALKEGRYVDNRDVVTNQRVAHVSASFAQRFWPQQSALGKQFSADINGNTEQFTIVGVVTDVAASAFRPKEMDDEVYLSGYQLPQLSATLFFRYISEPFAAENAFFRSLSSINTGIDILTIEEDEGEINAVEKMAAGFRDTIIYSGLFSLFLAVTGIYSLTAFAVTRRTHEIGIRRAIGAMNSQIVRLFVAQSMMQLLIGIGTGVLLTAAIFALAGKILAMPLTVYLLVYAAAILVLLAAVLTAVVLPTRATLKKEPSEALRFE